MCKTLFAVMSFLLVATVFAATAQATPCLIVTLTGTQGGPPAFNGLAGAGTLVRYGDDSNDCGAVKLQFDTGRGTTMRLSQVGVSAGAVNAIFFTHMHSDHTEGLADILQVRWLFNSTGPKVDVVCSSDAVSQLGVTMSCAKFVTHIGDALLHSGETDLRRSEIKGLLAGGPGELINLITFKPTDDIELVWSNGDVKVNAIRTTHIPGHASYRVDTPAGSVVIGGDAGNDVLSPPRTRSTSDQVEKLAKGTDIIVHSTTHPVMAPDRGSGMPPLIFHHQSATSDLGAMAKRAGAKHLMLTHLVPPIGAERQGPWRVPDGPLTEVDYRTAAEAGGFTGNIVVGTDLASVRLPTK